MSIQLVPINPGSAAQIPISRPVVLIGRHVECDIRIDSPQISRRHCCVAIAYERVVIRDLGSRNRVRVNGRIIDEARLNAGDEVAIGHFLYRVEILAPPPGNGSSKSPKPVGAQSPNPIIDLDGDLIPLD